MCTWRTSGWCCSIFFGESLSLLFGYHGCLRLETPKLKPSEAREISFRTCTFKRISTDKLSNQLLEAPPREKKSVWCMEAPFPPQVEQKHHHRNTFCHAICTTFSLHMFSTLKSLYPSHGHELQLEDQHLRGRKHPMVTFNPKKNNSQERRQTKFTLPRDALYPAFACGVGVPEIFCFSCSTRKIWGKRLLHNAKLSCWLWGWPLTSAKSLALKSSCGSGLGGLEPLEVSTANGVIREVIEAP